MMMQSFMDLIATATFSLGLFGAVLCILHTRDVWTFRALALVLLAICAMTVEDVPWPIADPATLRFTGFFGVIWLIGLMAVAPLFWNYVCVVTSITPRYPRRIWLHAALPGIAVLLGLAVACMPLETRLGLFTDLYPLPLGWPLFIGIAGEVLVIFAMVQWGGYLIAIIHDLLSYRKRLRSYVASVEHRELRWVWAIIIISATYWVVGTAEVVVDFFTLEIAIPELVDPMFGLILLVVLLLYGLRQRPSLAPDVAVPHESSTKYEKSALTSDMAQRIKRKLRAAMDEDKLHRDPNLSLWVLARHIGAPSNYISQTLNENVGHSFFDFVNGYRIAEAQNLLQDTDQTVLEITYNVGFNSRSSFYTAFKKVTGQTPTAYRAAVSAPT